MGLPSTNPLSISGLMDESGMIRYARSPYMVTRESRQSSDADNDGPLPDIGTVSGTGEHMLTQSEFNDIRKQHKQHTTVGRADIADLLKTSAAHGDLRENAEYDAAKEKQAVHEKNITRLENIMKNSTIVDPRATPGVGPGKHVTININGKTQTFEVTGSSSAKGTHQRLSPSSPIGAAILGKDVGHNFDVQTPSGRVSGSIKGITLADEPSGEPSLINADDIKTGGATGGPQITRVTPSIGTGGSEPNRQPVRGPVRGTGNYVRFGRLGRGLPESAPSQSTSQPNPSTPTPAPSELEETLSSLPPEYRMAHELRRNIGSAVESNMPIAPAFGRFAGAELTKPNVVPNVVTDEPDLNTRRTNLRSGTGRFSVQPGADIPTGGTMRLNQPDTSSVSALSSGTATLPRGSRFVSLPSTSRNLSGQFGDTTTKKDDEQS
jgi:transcription elongation factor GreA